MNKNKLWILVYLAFVLLVLSGCGPTHPCVSDSLFPVTLLSPISDTPATSVIPFYFGYSYDYCVPDSYQIEISDDPDMDNVVVRETSHDLPFLSSYPFEEGVTYYWQVRIVENGVEGPWSRRMHFRPVPPCSTSELPELIPELPTPNDLVMVKHVQFIFSYPLSDCYPGWYHIQVSDKDDFSTLVIDEVNPTTIDPIYYHLNMCQDYFWRVAGSDQGEDGPFSDPQRFTVFSSSYCDPYPCRIEDLEPPRHLFPDHEVIIDDPPELSWRQWTVCDPDSYLVRLRDQPPFVEADFEEYIITTGLSCNPAAFLEPASIYYWQVATQSLTDTGPFSDYQAFRTGPLCSEVQELASPTALLPEDQGLVISDSTMIVLGTSQQDCLPPSYWIEVSKDPAFPHESVINMLPKAIPMVIVHGLDDCSWYYWRVSADTGGTRRIWTPTFSFFVDYSTECISAEMDTSSVLPLHDTACRLGPGDHFDLVAYLMAGESVPLMGRDADHEYWIVQPGEEGQLAACWVPQANVELQGEAGDLPVYSPPPRASKGKGSDDGGVKCYSTMGKDACLAAGGTFRTVEYPPCLCP